MATLNREAAAAMADYRVHACTDITGFGLLGHMAEMVVHSRVGIRVFAGQVPVIDAALTYAGMGFVPGGAYSNRSFREPMVVFDPSVDPVLQDVLYDPQTSGGLLISVDREDADRLLQRLKTGGIAEPAVIGEVLSEPAGKIHVG